MSGFLNLLVYTLTFLLLHNVVTSRAVDASLSISITRSPRYVFVFGFWLTLATTVLSMPAWGVSRLLVLLPIGTALEPLFFGVLICGLYVGVHYLLRWKLPRLYARYSKDLALSLMNSVIITALTVPFMERMTFSGSILYGFEVGLSFTVGSFIVLEGQRRLATAKTPKAFRGIPVMLLYIGLLSMAFYGFVGHQLPF